jgi:hypothetical protein
MREHFVVPSIRSGEVAPAERSGVRHCEDSLKPLDVGNSLLGVHSVSISSIGVAIVNGVADVWVSPGRACNPQSHSALTSAFAPT